jgi:hypothetical protein
VIIVVLTVLGIMKMVVPDDQCISVAHVEFEITSDDRDELEYGENYEPDDRCFAAVVCAASLISNVFFFIFLLLCASLMSRLVVDIMLL